MGSYPHINPYFGRLKLYKIRNDKWTKYSSSDILQILTDFYNLTQKLKRVKYKYLINNFWQTWSYEVMYIALTQQNYCIKPF